MRQFVVRERVEDRVPYGALNEAHRTGWRFSYGDQPHHRLATSGDDHVFTCLNLGKDLGEAGLGFLDVELDGHVDQV